MSSSSAAADIPEEDVSQLQFGAGFSEDVHFLPNSHVAMLLAQLAERKYGGAGGAGERRAPEVFTKARTYASRFIGAVDASDVAAIDELFIALRALEFRRDGGGGGGEDEGGEAAPPQSIRLHEYQVSSEVARWQGRFVSAARLPRRCRSLSRRLPPSSALPATRRSSPSRILTRRR